MGWHVWRCDEGTVQAGMTANSQDDVLAWLGEPSSHGGAPVRRIDTHISAVFLVGSSRVDLQACKLEYSIVSPK